MDIIIKYLKKFLTSSAKPVKANDPQPEKKQKKKDKFVYNKH
jgi:hypothetical protein